MGLLFQLTIPFSNSHLVDFIWIRVRASKVTKTECTLTQCRLFSHYHARVPFINYYQTNRQLINQSHKYISGAWQRLKSWSTVSAAFVILPPMLTWLVVCLRSTILLYCNRPHSCLSSLQTFKHTLHFCVKLPAQIF